MNPTPNDLYAALDKARELSRILKWALPVDQVNTINDIELTLSSLISTHFAPPPEGSFGNYQVEMELKE